MTSPIHNGAIELEYTLDECRDIETRLVHLELLFPLLFIRPRFTGCPCESKMPVYKWKVT